MKAYKWINNALIIIAALLVVSFNWAQAEGGQSGSGSVESGSGSGIADGKKDDTDAPQDCGDCSDATGESGGDKAQSETPEQILEAGKARVTVVDEVGNVKASITTTNNAQIDITYSMANPSYSKVTVTRDVQSKTTDFFSHNLSMLDVNDFIDVIDTIAKEILGGVNATGPIGGLDTANTVALAELQDLMGTTHTDAKSVRNGLEAKNRSGGYKTVDISDINVLTTHKKMIENLLEVYSKSTLRDPLIRLGLLGVKIIVADNVRDSFYLPDIDTIVLKLKDVQTEGLAVLHHELLHAGLNKARKSATIDAAQYAFLTQLNTRRYADFDGYVGNAMGRFQKNGYASQEAFVLGWSYHVLSTRLESVASEDQERKIRVYLASIRNNALLRKFANGDRLYVLDSDATASDFRHFMAPFRNTSDEVRVNIGKVNQAISERLKARELCVPGEQRVVRKLSCGGGQGGSITDAFVCRRNHTWATSEQRFNSCDGNFNSGGE